MHSWSARGQSSVFSQGIRQLLAAQVSPSLQGWDMLQKASHESWQPKGSGPMQRAPSGHSSSPVQGMRQ